jgi:hypothetical protein
MSYDLAKLPIHSLLRPISEAAVAVAFTSRFQLKR